MNMKSIDHNQIITDLNKIPKPLLDQYNAYIEKLDYPQVFKREKQTDVPIHSHSQIEIVYIRNGQGIESVNGQNYTCKKGDLLFFNVGDHHSVTSQTGGVDTIHILLKPSYLTETSTQALDAVDILTLTSFREFETSVSDFLPKISFRGREIREIEGIFCTMLNEYEEKSIAFATILKSYLAILITRILRKVYKNNRGDIADAVEQISPDILEFIDKNYNKKITLNDLAEISCYNPSYFGQMFRKCVGVSPIEYLNRIRVEKAAELLSSSEISVDQVALEVGFSDRKRFYQIFKREMGVTPGQYKKEAAGMNNEKNTHKIEKGL